MASKWNNEYFARIGLIPGDWLFFNKINGEELETYIEREKQKSRKRLNRKISKQKEQGKEYYTPYLMNKIRAAQAYT